MSSLRPMTYLEDFLENASGVPVEVVRNLVLMRELDERAQALLQRCSERRDTAAATAMQGGEADAATAALRSDLRECRALSAEKVAIARQMYDLLDRNIRRLDADLRNFESELDGGSADGAAGDATAAAATVAAIYGDAESDSASSSASASPSGRHHHRNSRSASHHRHRHHHKHHRKGSASATSKRTPMPDMPVDPDEPVYCLCQQASFGKMIECENPKCRVEWFHYPCVGLSSSPKGHWFCPECRVLLKKPQQSSAAPPASLTPPL